MFVLVATLGACAPRPISTSAPTEEHVGPKVFYVSPEPFKSGSFPAPPVMNSSEQQADIATVLDWQKKRTETDCAKASVTADATYATLWGEKNPFPSPMPDKVKAFFGRITSDMEAATTAMKNRYQRTRPYNSYPDSKPCIKTSKGYSYPSGHTSFSRMYSGVLGDIIPERKDEFIQVADGIAMDRVIGGVHYPTDIAAGKRFGDEFHTQLLKNPGYLQDIEKLKVFLVK